MLANPLGNIFSRICKCTCIVGGIHFVGLYVLCVCVCVCVCVQASEEQLKDLFEGFGDVKYCQIVRDRRAGRSKG